MSPPSPTFTIFIPTYNRAHLLPRALASIEAQTCRDFEVVIVDDGSSDGTAALVAEWQAKVDFPVTYQRQPNQGKHAAHNAGVQRARGRLFVNLDSDDRLLPEALETFHRHWQAIPQPDKPGFAGVEGLIAINGRVKDKDRFPAELVDSDYLTIRYRRHVGGDKKNAILTEVLRRYPYPVFEGERHIRPSLILKRIAHAYRFRYVNEVVQDCEYQADGLSSDRFRLRMRNPRGFALYHLEDLTLHRAWHGLRQRVRSTIEYIRFSLHAGVGLREQMRQVGGAPLWALLLPAGAVRWLHDRYRIRVKDSNVKNRKPTPT